MEKLAFENLLCILCSCLCYAYGLSATVCPITESTRTRMQYFHSISFCNNQQAQIKGCPLLFRQFSHSGMVLFLLDSSREVQWSRIMEATVAMSSCSVMSSIVTYTDGNRNNQSLFDSIHCVQAVGADPVLALNFTLDEDPSTVKEHQNLKTCKEVELSHNSRLAVLLKKCTNILLMSGDLKSCNSSHWYALRVYNNELPSDKLLFDWMYTDRSLLEYRRLRIATIPYSGPFVQDIGVDENNKKLYQGVIVEMIRRFSQELNFEYDFVEPEDQSFGVQNENGTFNGAVGMLERGEIDMIAAPLTASYVRSQVVEFTPAAFHFDSVGIMISEPKGDDYIWRWMRPFTLDVWITIGAGLAACGVVLFALYEFNGYFMLTRFRVFKNCLWYLYAGLVGQGGEMEPVSWFGQTFLAFWWIFCIVITASYNGNLMALLTTKKMHLPYHNLTQLARQLSSGSYKICTENSTSFYNSMILNVDTKDEYYYILRWLKRHPGYALINSKACVELMMKDDSIALIAERSVLEWHQREFCNSGKNFIILRDDFYSSYYALAFQKGSPYTKLFSTLILKTIEAGLVEIWKKNYTKIPNASSRYCKIMQPDEAVTPADTTALAMKEVGCVFIILGIGSLSGLALFLLEKAVKHAKLELTTSWKITYG